MFRYIIPKIIVGFGIVAAIKIFLVMFIGGILNIAGALDAGTLTFTITAINILKILFSTFITGIVLYASFIIGAFLSIK